MYCHSGYCFSCEQQISINNEVLVNYITLEEILSSGTSLDQWPDFIIQSNTLTRIQSPHCATICDVQTERIEKKLSGIMFVEFSMGMISISKFRSQIRLADKEYRLNGLVKHLGMHFTSAVYNQYNSSWLYIDDLNDSCLNSFSLDEMFSSYTTGWFFAVYKKEDVCYCDVNDMNVNSNFEEVDFSLDVSGSSARYFCKNPKENSSFKKNEKIQKSASSDIRNVQLHLKELPKEISLTDHDYAATCNDWKLCYTNSENDKR